MESIYKTGMQTQYVVSNDLISATTAILKFKKTEKFTAGQTVCITTDTNIRPRLYSICSAEQDNEVSILYKIIPFGKLTPMLSLLKRGDPILISSPSGSFNVKQEPAWYIATGTGIAPFISMILSGYSENKTLVHGSRNFSDLYFYNELINKLGPKYFPCCISDYANNVYRGRITKFISGRSDLPENNKYYLCGKAEMVVETRDLLISKGIPFQNILSEIYF